MPQIWPMNFVTLFFFFFGVLSVFLVLIFFSHSPFHLQQPLEGKGSLSPKLAWSW